MHRVVYDIRTEFWTRPRMSVFLVQKPAVYAEGTELIAATVAEDKISGCMYRKEAKKN